MLLKNSSTLTLVGFLLLLSSCFSDTEKTEIGDTGFYFVNLGGYQRFLVNGKSEIVVPPTIIDFSKQQGGYVFVRQVVKEFTCSGSLRSEITNDFEYWSLHKKHEYRLIGPLPEVELRSQLALSDEGWAKLLAEIREIKKKRALSPSGNNCG